MVRFVAYESTSCHSSIPVKEQDGWSLSPSENDFKRLFNRKKETQRPVSRASKQGGEHEKDSGSYTIRLSGPAMQR